MKPKVILNEEQLEITITRLAHQLIETHDSFNHTVIIGLQPRGIFIAKRIHEKLQHILKRKDIMIGELDTTFYRDDFRKKELIPNKTVINFISYFHIFYFLFQIQKAILVHLLTIVNSWNLKQQIVIFLHS